MLKGDSHPCPLDRVLKQFAEFAGKYLVFISQEYVSPGPDLREALQQSKDRISEGD